MVIDHRAVGRLIKPLADRVALAIGRAVLRLVAERPGVQLVQVEGLKGDVLVFPRGFPERQYTSILAGMAFGF